MMKVMKRGRRGRGRRAIIATATMKRKKLTKEMKRTISMLRTKAPAAKS